MLNPTEATVIPGPCLEVGPSELRASRQQVVLTDVSSALPDTAYQLSLGLLRYRSITSAGGELCDVHINWGRIPLLESRTVNWRIRI